MLSPSPREDVFEFSRAHDALLELNSILVGLLSPFSQYFVPFGAQCNNELKASVIVVDGP